MTTGRTLLKVNNITKRFGGLVAVDNVSFDVKEHEVLGLIGPNGSGKTTIMNLISGAFKVSSGTISMQSRRFLPYQLTRFLVLGLRARFSWFVFFQA